MGSAEAELRAHLNNFVRETNRTARGVIQLCAAGKDYVASALESVLKFDERDSAAGSGVIQALDVDRAEPWPDGQDRQEDQTLPV